MRPGAGWHHPTGPTVAALLLRTVVATGLAADAVIHLRLAHGYQLAAPAGIGEGMLFRIQATLAIAAAVAVLIRGSRFTTTAAFLVAAAALGAVLVSRYVDLPAFGPFPSMHEPVWFPEKTLSAIAEALAAIGALGLLVAARTRTGPTQRPTPGSAPAPIPTEIR